MAKSRRPVFISLLLLASVLPLKAINVGDLAPDFTLKALGGETVQLSNLQGKIVFLYILSYG
jgi:peroxiredoxin